MINGSCIPGTPGQNQLARGGTRGTRRGTEEKGPSICLNRRRSSLQKVGATSLEGPSGKEGQVNTCVPALKQRRRASSNDRGCPSGPVRSCCGCRTQFPPDQMVRFVRDPAGRVLMDYRGKAPGRGAYVCPSAPCMKIALSGGFSRSFSTKIILPEGGSDLLFSEIKIKAYQRAMDMLGLLRKSGSLALGNESCTHAMTSGTCSLVILSTDLSERSSRKLVGAAQELGISVFRLGTMEVLGQTLGHKPVGIVGVKTRPGKKPGLLSTLERDLSRVESLNGLIGNNKTH